MPKPIWRRSALGKTLDHLHHGADVIDFIDTIFEQGKPIMANRTLGLLKRFFSWSVSRKYLTASPCEGAEPPGKENKRRRVLKPDELQAVWKAADRLGGPAGAAYKMLASVHP